LRLKVITVQMAQQGGENTFRSAAHQRRDQEKYPFSYSAHSLVVSLP
jgi:hypothetical protein